MICSGKNTNAFSTWCSRSPCSNFDWTTSKYYWAL